MIDTKSSHKKYYNKNKERISQNRKQKVTCECGLSCNKYNLNRHRKTWDHHYFNGTLEMYNNSS